MINKNCGFLIVFIILFLMYSILKKHVEQFNTVVINGDIDKKINYEGDLFRFSKLCIGKTCMDSNVLASVIDLFKSDNPLLKETLCNDNVCLFPSHLKMFNNNYNEKAKIYNIANGNDISNITSFSSAGGLPDSNGFKMALVEDTDTLLDNFGINDQRYKTKMMSGRICYAPNTSSKYNVQYYDTHDHFPTRTTQKDIVDYTDCYKGNSQTFRMGKPYDMLNKLDLNIDENITEIKSKLAEDTKIKYTKRTVKIARAT